MRLIAQRQQSRVSRIGLSRAEWHALVHPVMQTRPEARFVTLCVRESNAGHRDGLRLAASAVRDWQAVVEIALQHAVTAHVHEAVAREDLRIPETAKEALRYATIVTVGSVMRIDLALCRVLRKLGESGIPAIVLKGPVLARTIYPRPVLRPYTDIDLLVQQQHEADAARALVEHGLREVPYAAEAARREHAGHVHEGAAFHRLFRTADDVLLELHTDPLQLGVRTICEQGRWQRAVAAPRLQGALMFGPEDQVVQLSAHVHKHGFDRLIWLKDLDALLRMHRDRLDWNLVERVARDEGVLASVWYSLVLARVMLSAPVSDEMLRRLRPSLPIRALYRCVWPVSRIADLKGCMRRRAVQLHVADSWRGVLPGLILMGRRRVRARAVVRLLLPS